jgi:hypothetical protein
MGPPDAGVLIAPEFGGVGREPEWDPPTLAFSLRRSWKGSQNGTPDTGVFIASDRLLGLLFLASRYGLHYAHNNVGSSSPEQMFKRS